jgi:hypothetical protein
VVPPEVRERVDAIVGWDAAAVVATIARGRAEARRAAAMT